jgi:hypothetical protein
MAAPRSCAQLKGVEIGFAYPGTADDGSGKAPSGSEPSREASRPLIGRRHGFMDDSQFPGLPDDALAACHSRLSPAEQGRRERGVSFFLAWLPLKGRGRVRIGCMGGVSRPVSARSGIPGQHRCSTVQESPAPDGTVSARQALGRERSRWTRHVPDGGGPAGSRACEGPRPRCVGDGGGRGHGGGQMRHSHC